MALKTFDDLLLAAFRAGYQARHDRDTRAYHHWRAGITEPRDWIAPSKVAAAANRPQRPLHAFFDEAQEFDEVDLAPFVRKIDEAAELAAATAEAPEHPPVLFIDGDVVRYKTAANREFVVVRDDGQWFHHKEEGPEVWRGRESFWTDHALRRALDGWNPDVPEATYVSSMSSGSKKPDPTEPDFQAGDRLQYRIHGLDVTLLRDGVGNWFFCGADDPGQLSEVDDSLAWVNLQVGAYGMQRLPRQDVPAEA